MTKINMAELLAKARAQKAAIEAEPPPETAESKFRASLRATMDKTVSTGDLLPPIQGELEARYEATKQQQVAIEQRVQKKKEQVLLASIAKTVSKSSASAAIAGLRARLAAGKNPPVITSTPISSAAISDGIPFRDPELPAVGGAIGMHGEAITYNAKQQSFIDLISSGQSCVLLGAAGTGKTTCSRGGNAALIAAGLAGVLQGDGHKYLVSGTPGIVIISYTRRAVNNIRKVQSNDLKENCITSHKLLEYQPIYYEIEDAETGATKKTMRFEPTRCATNPLPASMHTIVVEEASMLGIDLYQELEAALDHNVQWVFIGDIQQLPPVFGPAILGFKMLELPVVELTQVYRQALKSPIIRLAHRILSGKPIPPEEYKDWKQDDEHGSLTIHPWKKKLNSDNAVLTLDAFFKDAITKGEYNPDEDIILIPYNKACGTIELNAHIANFLARRRCTPTFEVMAGFNKHYFSVGDRILYDREDAEIIDIHPNPAYNGGRVQPSSTTLDYWGHNPNIANEKSFSAYDGQDDVDFLLATVASSVDEDRVTQSSHRLVIRLTDTAQEVTVSKAAEINALLLAYALTVHKAQGSEWRKVFFCLHQSHATMLQRELLYTGVTRAREELYVICEPKSFTKGILSQRIKGNTLAEKAVFFKGKVLTTAGVKS